MTASRKKTKKKSNATAKATKPVAPVMAEKVASEKSATKHAADTKTTTSKKKSTDVGVSAELVFGEDLEVIQTAARKSAAGQAHFWNKWLALLLGAQAIAIAFLSVDRALPVTTHFLAKDTLGSQVAGHTVFAVATRQLFTVNIRYMVTVFLAVSAVMFGLAAWHKRVSAASADAKSQWRTVGQGVAGAIMIATIAMLAGVYDLSTLVMLSALSLVAPVLTVFAGRQKAPNAVRALTWVGLVAGALPWAALAFYIFGANFYAGLVPGYVYGVFASLLVCFVATAVLGFLRQRSNGRWANAWYVERVYMVVGLVAQTALAWQIFAGTLHP